MLKSAHFGADFDPAAAARLNLDVLHPTAPWHEKIPLGEYGPLPDVGKPILWQASRAGYAQQAYSVAQIKNVLAMPKFNRWWILGNEQDLPFGNTPASTPREYVQGIVAMMMVIVPLSPAPRRFNLSLGSKIGFDRGWAEAVLNEMQREAPGILALFDSVSTNYYHQPLGARECVRWLVEFHRMMDRAGVGEKRLWLKEVGIGKSQALGNAGAAAFISDLFDLIRKRQNNGGLSWLEMVSWFAANDLTEYHMPYEPLLEDGKLTDAGKAWANA